ncbi:hypothetical protein LTSEURB_5456, partial [Salmonella enterica subsp. enterica serovar Urbana str. R8-2977]
MASSGATFHVTASSALKLSGTDWLRLQRAKLAPIAR